MNFVRDGIIDNINYFLFNLNFNHSFNQTYINTKPISTKNTFYKTIFFQITTTKTNIIPTTL
jgi:hypothetical protein